ncbi:MAG: hypothetical protein ACKOU7_00755 [Ferruginibacter sp.]
MSLDNIQLPDTILQSLYSKCLYDLDSDKSVLSAIQTPGISFLGNNQKKITILVNCETAIYLPDEELNFLLGILTACKLSMADIALVNLSKNPGISYTALSEQLKAEKVFVFGPDAAVLELPLQFPHYQVQPFNNQVYLSAVSLKELQANKEEKMKLWTCLKKIFSL